MNNLNKKIEIAKREARNKIAMIKNKPPSYVELPPIIPGEDPETAASNDLNALQKGFKQRAQDENKRFRLATDSEYWFCVCFQSREQKDGFLNMLNLSCLDDKYIDGSLFAEKLGVNIPNVEMSYNVSERVDKTWGEFVKGDAECLSENQKNQVERKPHVKPQAQGRGGHQDRKIRGGL